MIGSLLSTKQRESGSLRWILLLLCCAYVRTDDHYVMPTVTLRSCVKSTAVLAIQDLQDGGMMFIRTDDVYNMQPTLHGDTQYSCSFTNCAIIWGEAFEFVIQRQTTLQTKHDVHLTFRCIPDTNPIDSGDDASKANGEQVVQRFVYSAQAEMRFYTNTTELATGSFVKLGTHIHMVIRITNNFEDFADLSIKSCTASNIYMFENRCPLDYDLMGMFNKTGMGTVWNEFLMFRPTSLSWEPLDILFSCLLEVCRAPCPEYSCNTTDPSSRKRRTAGPLKSVIVGTVFSVGTEERDIVEKKIEDNCVALYIWMAATAFLSFLIFISIATFFYYYLEEKSLSKIKHKLTVRKEGGIFKDSATSQDIDDKTIVTPNLKVSDNSASSSNAKIAHQGTHSKTEVEVESIVKQNNKDKCSNVSTSTVEKVITSNQMVDSGMNYTRGKLTKCATIDCTGTRTESTNQKTDSSIAQPIKYVQFKLGDPSQILYTDFEVTAVPDTVESNSLQQRQDVFTISKLKTSLSVDIPTLKSALKKSIDNVEGHFTPTESRDNTTTGNVMDRHLQRTIAVEAQQFTRMAIQSGIKHFLMNDRSGRRNSNIQKTDSQRSLLSKD